ncbi:PAS domain-containing sensor histidine kinase [Natronospira bacteriovora]|uniref:PAS domain S-box protein n=1 Tax=Natronospira bacteriovora TaxID=3069753 RepID=A0ABU0W9G3_9GAMM|nr:PAS domain S-box protein [Natronospira sp. AB-CW4]MDQ2070075.1 PAS domain S-box protein [Natronospira sp. AB-CW4]
MIAPYSQDTGHLEHIVEIAHEAVVTIDAGQRIVAFNRSAERMFGYRRDQMLGTALERLLPGSVAPHHRQLVRHFLDRGPQDRAMAPRRPVRARNAGGEEFPVLVTIYSTGHGESAVATAVVVDPRERRDSNEQLRRLLEENRRNGRQLIKRENDYRRTLAKLIHNDLAQEAVSIAVNLELARKRMPQHSDELESLFKRIEDATRRVHDTVDHLINRTRPPLLDNLNLPQAVDDCIRRLGIRESGMSVDTRIDPQIAGIRDPAKTIAYRIIQESLTNIMRHARPAATRIAVHLGLEAADGQGWQLMMHIDDDGQGITPPTNNRLSGVGLEQIREWCTALGGELSTGTSPWGGFRLSARFPIEDELS